MRGRFIRVRYLGSLLLVGGLLCTGCQKEGPATPVDAPVTPVVLSENSEKRVVAFCSACHVMPPAGSFPRAAWRHEVMRGYGFYAKSGRKDLDPPPPTEAIEYFRSRAPEALDLSSKISDSETPIRFEIETMVREPGRDLTAPGLAHVAFETMFDDVKPNVYAIDMRRGELLRLKRGKQNIWEPKFQGLRNPCHFESCDLDGDGVRDALVADLGSYKPEEHAYGRVLWLRGKREGGAEVSELMKDIGRIADVRPADFNSDGKLDLVVAEFGMLKTGSVWLLTRTDSGEESRPEFSQKRLLHLPGASHVPTGDFDGDGKTDFIAFLSQEHERVFLFRNQGDGEFEQKLLWQAPDPAYGMSGVEPADLDGDGDLDLLFTSGDTFDGPYLKPSHGIHWLENEGGKGFTYHRIAHLLGAYSAKAGDLDGDGDLDIVASCWAPTPNDLDNSKLPAIVCGLQTSKGQFEMSVLHHGALNYVALAMGDVDADGDLDVIAGTHVLMSQNPLDCGMIFLNQGLKAGSKR